VPKFPDAVDERNRRGTEKGPPKLNFPVEKAGSDQGSFCVYECMCVQLCITAPPFISFFRFLFLVLTLALDVDPGKIVNAFFFLFVALFYPANHPSRQ